MDNNNNNIYDDGNPSDARQVRRSFYRYNDVRLSFNALTSVAKMPELTKIKAGSYEEIDALNRLTKTFGSIGGAVLGGVNFAPSGSGDSDVINIIIDDTNGLESTDIEIDEVTIGDEVAGEESDITIEEVRQDADTTVVAQDTTVVAQDTTVVTQDTTEVPVVDTTETDIAATTDDVRLDEVVADTTGVYEDETTTIDSLNTYEEGEGGEEEVIPEGTDNGEESDFLDGTEISSGYTDGSVLDTANVTGTSLNLPTPSLIDYIPSNTNSLDGGLQDNSFLLPPKQENKIPFVIPKVNRKPIVPNTFVTTDEASSNKAPKTNEEVSLIIKRELSEEIPDMNIKVKDEWSVNKKGSRGLFEKVTSTLYNAAGSIFAPMAAVPFDTKQAISDATATRWVQEKKATIDVPMAKTKVGSNIVFKVKAEAQTEAVYFAYQDELERQAEEVRAIKMQDVAAFKVAFEKRPEINVTKTTENFLKEQGYEASKLEDISGEELEKVINKIDSTNHLFVYKDAISNEIRGLGQWDSAKVVKGAGQALVKLPVHAGATALSLPYGIVTSLYHWDSSHMYDNNLLTAYDNTLKSIDDGMPIYALAAEADYTLAQRLGTSTFYGRDLLGGVSYLGGALLAEAAWATATGGGSLAAKAAVRATAKAGSKVAIKSTAKEAAEVGVARYVLTYGGIVDKLQKTATVGKTTIFREFQRVTSTKLGGRLNAGRFALTTGGGEAVTETHQIYKDIIKQAVELNGGADNISPELKKEILDEALSISNKVFLAQWVMTASGSAITVGRHFNLLPANSSISYVNRMLGDGFSKRLVDDVAVYSAKNSGGFVRGAARILLAGAPEGAQEFGQGVSTKVATAYMDRKYNPDKTQHNLNFVDVLSKSLEEQLIEPSGQVETLLGVVLGSGSAIAGGTATVGGKIQKRNEGLAEAYNSAVKQYNSVISHNTGTVNLGVSVQEDLQESHKLTEDEKLFVAKAALYNVFEAASNMGLSDGHLNIKASADLMTKEYFGVESQEALDAKIKELKDNVDESYESYKRATDLVTEYIKKNPDAAAVEDVLRFVAYNGQVAKDVINKYAETVYGKESYGAIDLGDVAKEYQDLYDALTGDTYKSKVVDSLILEIEERIQFRNKRLEKLYAELGEDAGTDTKEVRESLLSEVAKAKEEVKVLEEEDSEGVEIDTAKVKELNTILDEIGERVKKLDLIEAIEAVDHSVELRVLEAARESTAVSVDIHGETRTLAEVISGKALESISKPRASAAIEAARAYLFNESQLTEGLVRTLIEQKGKLIKDLNNKYGLYEAHNNFINSILRKYRTAERVKVTPNERALEESEMRSGTKSDTPEAYIPPDTPPNNDAPNNDAPNNDAPNNDAPTDDAPNNDAPNNDAPTDDAPTDDAPTDDAPTDDAPTDDAPTDDAQGGIEDIEGITVLNENEEVTPEYIDTLFQSLEFLNEYFKVMLMGSSKYAPVWVKSIINKAGVEEGILSRLANSEDFIHPFHSMMEAIASVTPKKSVNSFQETSTITVLNRKVYGKRAFLEASSSETKIVSEDEVIYKIQGVEVRVVNNQIVESAGVTIENGVLHLKGKMFIGGKLHNNKIIFIDPKHVLETKEAFILAPDRRGNSRIVNQNNDTVAVVKMPLDRYYHNEIVIGQVAFIRTKIDGLKVGYSTNSDIELVYKIGNSLFSSTGELMYDDLNSYVSTSFINNEDGVYSMITAGESTALIPVHIDSNGKTVIGVSPNPILGVGISGTTVFIEVSPDEPFTIHELEGYELVEDPKVTNAGIEEVETRGAKDLTSNEAVDDNVDDNLDDNLDGNVGDNVDDNANDNVEGTSDASVLSEVDNISKEQGFSLSKIINRVKTKIAKRLGISKEEYLEKSKTKVIKNLSEAVKGKDFILGLSKGLSDEFVSNMTGVTEDDIDFQKVIQKYLRGNKLTPEDRVLGIVLAMEATFKFLGYEDKLTAKQKGAILEEIERRYKDLVDRIKNTDEFLISEFSRGFLLESLKHAELQYERDGIQLLLDGNERALDMNLKNIRDNQRLGLLHSINQLGGFPIEFKFLMLSLILKGNVAKNVEINIKENGVETGKTRTILGRKAKRNKTTVGNHQRLDADALNEVYESLNLDENDTHPIDVYAEHADKGFLTRDEREDIAREFMHSETNKGYWLHFESTSDSYVATKLGALSNEVSRDMSSPWSTGEGSQFSYLPRGDFYLFVNKDFEPKITVRYEDNDIGEVKGTSEGQKLSEEESYIAGDFLPTIPSGSRYLINIHTTQLHELMKKSKDNGTDITPYVTKGMVYAFITGNKLETSNHNESSIYTKNIAHFSNELNAATELHYPNLLLVKGNDTNIQEIVDTYTSKHEHIVGFEGKLVVSGDTSIEYNRPLINVVFKGTVTLKIKEDQELILEDVKADELRVENKRNKELSNVINNDTFNSLEVISLSIKGLNVGDLHLKNNGISLSLSSVTGNDVNFTGVGGGTLTITDSSFNSITGVNYSEFYARGIKSNHIDIERSENVIISSSKVGSIKLSSITGEEISITNTNANIDMSLIDVQQVEVREAETLSLEGFPWSELNLENIKSVFIKARVGTHETSVSIDSVSDFTLEGYLQVYGLKLTNVEANYAALFDVRDSQTFTVVKNFKPQFIQEGLSDLTIIGSAEMTDLGGANISVVDFLKLSHVKNVTVKVEDGGTIRIVNSSDVALSEHYGDIYIDESNIIGDIYVRESTNSVELKYSSVSGDINIDVDTNIRLIDMNVSGDVLVSSASIEGVKARRVNVADSRNEVIEVEASEFIFGGGSLKLKDSKVTTVVTRAEELHFTNVTSGSDANVILKHGGRVEVFNSDTPLDHDIEVLSSIEISSDMDLNGLNVEELVLVLNNPDASKTTKISNGSFDKLTIKRGDYGYDNVTNLVFDNVQAGTVVSYKALNVTMVNSRVSEFYRLSHTNRPSITLNLKDSSVGDVKTIGIVTLDNSHIDNLHGLVGGAGYYNFVEGFNVISIGDSYIGELNLQPMEGTNQKTFFELGEITITRKLNANVDIDVSKVRFKATSVFHLFRNVKSPLENVTLKDVRATRIEIKNSSIGDVYADSVTIYDSNVGTLKAKYIIAEHSKIRDINVMEIDKSEITLTDVIIHSFNSKFDTVNIKNTTVSNKLVLVYPLGGGIFSVFEDTELDVSLDYKDLDNGNNYVEVIEGTGDNILFQEKRGAIVQTPNATLTLLDKDNADVTTPIHEVVHEYEKVLTPNEVAIVEEWSGHKHGTKEFSEAFALGAERYIFEGRAEGDVEGIFAKLKEWFREVILDAIEYFGSINELNTEIITVYDALFRDDRGVLFNENSTDLEADFNSAVRRMFGTFVFNDSINEDVFYEEAKKIQHLYGKINYQDVLAEVRRLKQGENKLPNTDTSVSKIEFNEDTAFEVLDEIRILIGRLYYPIKHNETLISLYVISSFDAIYSMLSSTLSDEVLDRFQAEIESMVGTDKVFPLIDFLTEVLTIANGIESVEDLQEYLKFAFEERYQEDKNYKLSEPIVLPTLGLESNTPDGSVDNNTDTTTDSNNNNEEVERRSDIMMRARARLKIKESAKPDEFVMPKLPSENGLVAADILDSMEDFVMWRSAFSAKGDPVSFIFSIRLRYAKESQAVYEDIESILAADGLAFEANPTDAVPFSKADLQIFSEFYLYSVNKKFVDDTKSANKAKVKREKREAARVKSILNEEETKAYVGFVEASTIGYGISIYTYERVYNMLKPTNWSNFEKIKDLIKIDEGSISIKKGSREEIKKLVSGIRGNDKQLVIEYLIGGLRKNEHTTEEINLITALDNRIASSVAAKMVKIKPDLFPESDLKSEGNFVAVLRRDSPAVIRVKGEFYRSMHVTSRLKVYVKLDGDLKLTENAASTKEFVKSIDLSGLPSYKLNSVEEEASKEIKKCGLNVK